MARPLSAGSSTLNFVVEKSDYVISSKTIDGGPQAMGSTNLVDENGEVRLIPVGLLDFWI